MMSQAVPPVVEIVGDGPWAEHFADIKQLALADWPASLPSNADVSSRLQILCGDRENQRAAAIDGLSRGNIVWLAEPCFWTTEDIASLESAARQANSPPSLAVVSPRRFDGDFQQALSLIQQGELGELQAIRMIAWTPPAMHRRGAGASIGESASQPDFAPQKEFERELAGAVDLLLEMTTALPQQCRLAGSADDWSLCVTFGSGLRAEVEQRRRGHLPFSTGWMVDGELAGYRQGRLYRSADDGETIDVPVPPMSDSTSSLVDELRKCLSERSDPAFHPMARTTKTLGDMRHRVLLYDILREQIGH